jgi:hypothetical protein
MKMTNQTVRRISAGFNISNNSCRSRKAFSSAYFFLFTPLSPSITVLDNADFVKHLSLSMSPSNEEGKKDGKGKGEQMKYRKIISCQFEAKRKS